METDYKKKYEEALSLAKSYYGKGQNEFLDTLFPELAESEDEIHRKWILEYLYDGLRKSDEQFKEQFKSAIAWLEKQKESLHITEMCKENTDSFTDEDEDRTINGCLLAANAERRCKRVSEELLEELGLADYTKFFYEQGVEKGKKEREKQKEQKPVEYLSKRKVYDIMNKLTELSTSDLIPIESEEYVKIHEITSDVCSLLDYPIEQKPVEWSKEDEEHLDSIIESYKELLKDYSANHGVDYIPYNTPVVARTVLNDIKFLESLRSSWKPSKEQMKALNKVVNGEVLLTTQHKSLESLHNELQKLL